MSGPSCLLAAKSSEEVGHNSTNSENQVNPLVHVHGLVHTFMDEYIIKHARNDMISVLPTLPGGQAFG